MNRSYDFESTWEFCLHLLILIFWKYIFFIQNCNSFSYLTYILHTHHNISHNQVIFCRYEKLFQDEVSHLKGVLNATYIYDSWACDDQVNLIKQLNLGPIWWTPINWKTLICYWFTHVDTLVFFYIFSTYKMSKRLFIQSEFRCWRVHSSNIEILRLLCNW